jgi:hypothetical protein
MQRHTLIIILVLILVAGSLTIAVFVYRNRISYIKTCPGAVAVQALNISSLSSIDLLIDAPVNDSPTLAVAPTVTGKTVTVTATGPVLGTFMDYPEVAMDLECVAKGLVLTATVTRDAGYTGSRFKNESWHPRIVIVVALPAHHTIPFTTIWRMRLSDGTEVDGSLPYPDPNHTYPITLTTQLSSDKSR